MIVLHFTLTHFHSFLLTVFAMLFLFSGFVVLFLQAKGLLYLLKAERHSFCSSAPLLAQCVAKSTCLNFFLFAVEDF